MGFGWNVELCWNLLVYICNLEVGVKHCVTDLWLMSMSLFGCLLKVMLSLDVIWPSFVRTVIIGSCLNYEKGKNLQ